MCGIAGYIGREAVDEGRVRAALGLMNHRGPDHQASLSVAHGENNVALLHSRLSIIDLDPRSNQPFTLGDCTLVFNGEIYNYLELRELLEAKGISFRTESDTEVLLQSYLTFGSSCVERFEGMWAFAIFDRRTGTLLLSRDRFAEKPLYYWRTPTEFFFGSEVKIISALSGQRFQPNMAQLSRYLVNGYKSLYKSGETFFEAVEEVPYATNLTIAKDLRLQEGRYWKPVCEPRPMTLTESIEGFRERLFESVRLRLRADVPLAFCLSGGVDSAALASIAAKQFSHTVSTFSIVDPDERYNEAANIQATVDDLACEHTIIRLERTDTLRQLEQLIRYHDAPLCTISYYVHAMLSRAIAEQGYKVAVSGTAADELVTGYYDHFLLHLYEMRGRPGYSACVDDWWTHVRPFVRNPHLREPELYFKNPDFREHIYLNSDIFASFLHDSFDEPFSETRFCGSPLRNRMMNELFHEVVPPILHEDDLNSMFHSVENRSPYLDKSLAEFAWSIPTEHLIRDGYGKFILRKAVEGVLNEQVRTDRRKVGFNASIGSVFDLDGAEIRGRILDAGPIYDYVHKHKVEALLNRGVWTNSESKFLFGLVNARIFLETRAEGVGAAALCK